VIYLDGPGLSNRCDHVAVDGPCLGGRCEWSWPWWPWSPACGGGDGELRDVATCCCGVNAMRCCDEDK